MGGGGGGRLFEVGHLKVLFRGAMVGGGGRLLEAGRLLNFSTFRVGAYSRWALIRGWALNRINTVYHFYREDNEHLDPTDLTLSVI